MIIDCHGHYTTAPRSLEHYRERQAAAFPDVGRLAGLERPAISDEQLRDSLEQGQLRVQDSRGIDLTIFSPRAAGMSHHIGDAATSVTWSRICNDLIRRACSFYPTRFAGVCQLPQSPGVPPANCIPELERCVAEMGFIGCRTHPALGFGPGQLQLVDIVADPTRMCDRPNGSGFVVLGIAYPDGAIAAHLHDDATQILQEFAFIPAGADGAVACAQHAKGPVQTKQLLLGPGLAAAAAHR